MPVYEIVIERINDGVKLIFPEDLSPRAAKRGGPWSVYFGNEVNEWNVPNQYLRNFLQAQFSKGWATEALLSEKEYAIKSALAPEIIKKELEVICPAESYKIKII